MEWISFAVLLIPLVEQSNSSGPPLNKVNAANSLYATTFLPGSIAFLLTAAYGSKGFLELRNKLVQDRKITQDILIFGRCNM